jgi:phosphoribosylaminoimidazole-succinocarboxamide synthase
MINQVQKKIITTAGKEHLVVEYDDFFLSQKNIKVRVKDLGEKFASINSYFFDYLKGFNIPVAYVKKTGKKELNFLKFVELPFRIKILNAADKRTSKIFSIKPGSHLELPVFEMHYGNSNDSLISESHIISFNLCTYEDLKFINRLCSKINAIIKSFFERRDNSIIELTCGFGKFDNKIYLIDEFSPVSLRIIKNDSDEKFPDPYKIETAAQMIKYTDHILKFTSS